VLYSEPLRVRHFNPVTLLATVATVTRDATPVRWLELLAMLLHELRGVVSGLDIFKSVASFAKFHQRRFQHSGDRAVVSVMASGTFRCLTRNRMMLTDL
jgi:hypothetical protein